jgi:monofunctional biosynthetic peptidoglycan transglycosylase
MARPSPSPGPNEDRSTSASLQERALTWGRRFFVGVTSVLATYLGGCVVALGLYAAIFPPITGVQVQRRVEAALAGAPAEQAYDPVPLTQIDRDLARAVVAGEDSRFFRHWGIDWKEVGKAIQAYRRGEDLRGASSITQQLVKNLFLTTHSTVFRKALEVPLTIAAELLLSKRRILELYLNVIEWGPGVYGAEAATHYHFGTSARPLTRSRAAALAACIPNPLDRRPQTVGSYQYVILERMNILGPLPLPHSPAAPNAP